MDAVIVVPVHGAVYAWERLAASLARAREASCIRWRTVVIDDASPDPVVGADIRHDTPRGYAHAANTAALTALRDGVPYWGVANSDLVVGLHAIERLIYALEEDSWRIAVGPALSSAGSGQGSDHTITLEALEELDQERRDLPARCSRLNGAMILARTDAWVSYGPWDERFGRGAAEEEEWQLRVADMRDGDPGTWVVPSAIVWHERHASYRAVPEIDSDAQWRQNADEMARKRADREEHAWLTYPRALPG
jgi:GT2 family glycosyltransferase